MTAQPVPVAMANPLDQPVGEIVKTWWPILAAVGGGLLAWIKRIRSARAKEREEQRLQGKAVRYLLDADRHALMQLMLMAPANEQLSRQKVLVDGIRDELWVHDGHESAREREQQAEDVIKVLTRTQAIRSISTTQRIKPALEGQDMFRPDDIEGGDRG